MIATRPSAARRWLARGAMLSLALMAAACKDSTGGDDSGPLAITSLNPSSGVVNGGELQVTVNGRRFTNGSVVLLNGFSLATTFVDAKQLQVTVPAAAFQQPGVLQLSVMNPGATGETSAIVNFAVQYAAPTLTGLSVDTASAGRADVLVTATGTGFTAATKVRWNGVDLATTYRSATEVAFVLGTAQLATDGTATVTVANPTPGGGVSAGRTFTITKPVPVITVLPSAGATAGRPGFTLTIHGTGFMQGASVEWNGAPRAATFVSGSRLEVGVSSADVAAPGTITLRVVNPGGAAPSNAATLTVRALPAAGATTADRIPILGVRDVAWDPGTARLYVTVRGFNPELGNTITRVNPATGALDGSVFVGSDPNRITRSNDGQFLYVGLDGASAVRQVHIPSFTAGLQWSLEAGQVAGDLAVMPGVPGTVAVSRQRPGISPPLEGVTIYDNGVARPVSSSGHTGGNRIEFLERPDVLYGYNNAHTGFEFFNIGIDAAGARHVTTNGGLIGGFITDIVGAAGRIYGTDGSVVDPERRIKLGSFGGGSPIAVDPAAGRLYAMRAGGIAVIDLNTFQLLAAVPWPDGISLDYFGAGQRMYRVGTDALAFVDGTALFILRNPVFGP